MIIKSADDKTKRLRLLEAIEQSQTITKKQKEWCGKARVKLQRGIHGEKNAAHYIDSFCRDSKGRVVLHDLRLEVDDEVAQIDHLMINRLFEFFLFETKNFDGNLTINELGEFSVKYDNEREYGIESPIEQSKRHERILKKALEQLGIVGRIGINPVFHHLVLLHPKAVISRPPLKKFDTSCIIKADLFPAWYTKFADKIPVTEAFIGLINIRRKDTIIQWGEMLKQIHKPEDLLRLPDFMQPQKTVKNTSDFHSEKLKKETDLIDRCAKCNRVLAENVIAFCKNNEKRFGGLLYCYDHQRGLGKYSNN